MKLALCQIDAVVGDFDGNIDRILAAVDKARSYPEAGVVTTEHPVAPGHDATASGHAAMSDAVIPPVLADPPGFPDLIVLPEMSLCGYPPMDLLDQPRFADRDEESFRKLQKLLPADSAVAVGHIGRNTSGLGRPLTNIVSVLYDGRVVFEQAKTLLPTYDVFDEARYFEPARQRNVWHWRGVRIGFAICEDLWRETTPVPGMRYPVDPPRELLDAGAELIIVPSASPYQIGKVERRAALCADLARTGSIPVAYCNMAGADDSLVFDGRSLVVDSNGRLVAMGGFGVDILHVDTGIPHGSRLEVQPASPVSGAGAGSSGITGVATPRGAAAPADRTISCPSPATTIVFPDPWEEAERALVEGIRGYMRKCGFGKAHLGLSGGIDSALVAVLAADAIGPENLTCIMLPSRFSSAGSIDDSVELVRALGCRVETIAIESAFSSFLATMEPHFAGLPFGLAEENLQARIRGDILMAWSNKFGSMLLTTGNKSELAVGYCTLYGDMCGALAPIGDLLKTEVFALSESIYRRRGLIPRAILDKPPSAELRPDQKDQDSLPPYDELDAILRLYIEGDHTADEIISMGLDGALVRRVLTMTARAEYKRRQAAPVIKMSPRAFGMGRRLPIARAVYEA